jgi:hypothetical protein
LSLFVLLIHFFLPFLDEAASLPLVLFFLGLHDASELLDFELLVLDKPPELISVVFLLRYLSLGVMVLGRELVKLLTKLPLELLSVKG